MELKKIYICVNFFLFPCNDFAAVFTKPTVVGGGEKLNIIPMLCVRLCGCTVCIHVGCGSIYWKVWQGLKNKI